MSKKDLKAVWGFGGLALAVLLLAGGVVWLAWRGMGALTLTTLKALVLILAVATPGTFWAGWRLGRYEARAVLHGVDEIGERVMSTAEKVASLRVGVHRARKNDGAVVVMPMALPPIVHRAALGGGKDDVVDL